MLHVKSKTNGEHFRFWRADCTIRVGGEKIQAFPMRRSDGRQSVQLGKQDSERLKKRYPDDYKPKGYIEFMAAD